MKEFMLPRSHLSTARIFHTLGLVPTKIIFILLVCLAPVSARAQLDCMDSEYLVSAEFGVNPAVSDLPPRLGLPGASAANLQQVSIAWLAQANRERDQEIITVDYPAMTATQVDVYDGSILSVSLTDLRQAEIDPGSNFGRGQLNVNWCMPVGREDGLIFAIYGSGGQNVGFQAGPFTVGAGNRAVAVLNEAITNQVGLEFNTGGADETREDIQAVTGVYPPRYLAEAIFQRDIPAMLRDELENQALFQNPANGMVVGNTFVVTGAGAEAFTPTAVDRVLQDGSDIMFSTGLVPDLDARLGPVSFDAHGERRPAWIIDGRAELSTNIPACAGDQATLTAEFVRPSILQSVIELWKGDALLASRTNQELQETVACDGTYEVRGYRNIRERAADNDRRLFYLSLDELAQAGDYVNTWLPASDTFFFLDNEEIRAMILGSPGTRSYAPDMAEILAEHSNIGLDAVTIEAQLINSATPGSIVDMWHAFDPLLWDNDAEPPSKVRQYSDLCSGLCGTDYNMDQEGMLRMYELIKGLDADGAYNQGFLVVWVMNNPERYGGAPGGAPDINFNPTWDTQDPN